MDLITGCWTIIARSVCGNGASRVGRNNNILALAFERRYKIQKSYLDIISWPPNELEKSCLGLELPATDGKRNHDWV